MRFHLHKYKLESTSTRGHKHRLIGYTGNMIGLRNFHFHFFYGVCSYDNHSHYYSGITGMPVKTENGHIHKIEGAIEADYQHTHKYQGYTFEDISYTASRQAASCNS